VAVAVRPNSSTGFDDAVPEAALLFERYSERIHAYCLHVLRDRGDAEDAVQTTFFNAYRALRRGVTPEHEYAWLHTIAKNACRTLQRTKGRRAPVAADVDVDSIPGQADDGDREELRALLADALTGLPESQRRAVVLREWHGLSPVEIAARLGLSVPATHALLTRARRSLASALTTTIRGPLSALNLGALGDLLRASAKTLLASATPKTAVAAAVATVSVGVVGVGGIIVQRPHDDAPVHGTRPPENVVAPGAETAVTATTKTRAVRHRVTPSNSRVRSTRDATTHVPVSSRPAAPTASEPASAPETASAPAPEPQRPAVREDDGPSPPAPLTGKPSPPPPVEVPSLLPDLLSGDLPPVEAPPLPPVEVPPLPPVPELPVDVGVPPPQLPLP
jgi:RNA polymerase sigma factor (sigma-70 family)